ncbi:hypothetical protein L873DRAFT_1810718 [Choiromyces venosus 120613-1]|uniref:Uncharacterized protein n=1 Tax=Choiromyces venosus 120613-1 TaxID=1336337 RepID=A0A3N4JJJ3_9PEZI|nr:hypothetical protein L873DRAFT_1810718 [Choiromyces venosus 120613-1]
MLDELASHVIAGKAARIPPVPLDNCGFAIKNIVRNSPKELTVYFGRRRGKAIRQNHMSMTFETIDADRSTR